ncbi:MAG: alpha/beta fold hydrolase [Tenacibaculum sp.]|nr:alpha/beta fold hydrolase [Tenacibaculum sp.]
MKILHSKIVGKGKPLLILHGYFGMGDNWKTYANKLSEEGFEAHLIDQRNHGRSFHSNEFNYELLVEDLKNYIEYYKLGKVSLLGHSMGGKTAMLFSVKHSDLVDKLVVADISPKEYVPHHNTILTALNSVDFSVHNSRKLVDEQLAKYISEINVRNFLTKSLYWKEKEKLAFRFNVKSLIENNNEVGVALPSLTLFKGDVLFLRGENSKYILEEDISLIKNHFPNCKIKTIINAGHWLHAENPNDFYKELLRFLVCEV